MPETIDLRVIKTKRAIRSAFFQLLQKRDVAQIRVVELARCAEINKSTFYLHYHDIYALYEEILTDYIYREAAQFAFCTQFQSDPEAFVRGFFRFSSNSSDPAGRYLLRPENLQYCQGFLLLLIDAVSESIFAASTLPRTEDAAGRLRFLLGGMYAQAMAASPASDRTMPEAMVHYMAGQIRRSFPVLFAAP